MITIGNCDRSLNRTSFAGFISSDHLHVGTHHSYSVLAGNSSAIKDINPFCSLLSALS